MTSNSEQPSGDLRMQVEPDGMTLSWPMWPTLMWTQSEAFRRGTRVMFWFLAALVLGLAMGIPSMAFRHRNDEASLSNAATWQGRYGLPIALLGVTILLIELSLLMLWYLHGRILLQLRVTNIAAFVSGLSAGFRRTLDPRSAIMRFDTMCGVRHLVISNGGDPIRVGAGLDQGDLKQIAHAIEQVTRLPLSEMASPPPARFQVNELPQSGSVQINSLGSRVPGSSIRTAMILFFPSLLVLLFGFGMLIWAFEHDAVLAARRAEVKAARDSEPNGGIPWLYVFNAIVVSGGMLVSGITIRRMKSQSTMEISQTSATIGRGRRRHVIPRDDIEALVIAPRRMGDIDMRSLAMTAAGRRLSIHPYLAPEEADWMVKWIQSKWPEVQSKDA